MAERNRTLRTALRAGTLATFGLLGTQVRCASDSLHEGQSRLLDQACGQQVCTTTGTARIVTGPTSDSVGLKLGPGKGSARIPLPAFSLGADDSYDVEILVAGKGTATSQVFARASSCPPAADAAAGAPELQCSTPLSTETTFAVSEWYEWKRVGGLIGEDAGVAQEGLLVGVSTGVDGSSFDIADIRYTTYRTLMACSIGGGRPAGRVGFSSRRPESSR